MVAWWGQGPSQEVNGVVEAELAICILDVVVRQQVVDIKSSGIVREVDFSPLVAFGQGVAFSVDLSHSLDLDRLVKRRLIDQFTVLGDRLRGPEVVLLEKWYHFTNLLQGPRHRQVFRLKLVEELEDVLGTRLLVLNVPDQQAFFEYVKVDTFEAASDVASELLLVASHESLGLFRLFGGCGAGQLRARGAIRFYHREPTWISNFNLYNKNTLFQNN